MEEPHVVAVVVFFGSNPFLSLSSICVGGRGLPTQADRGGGVEKNKTPAKKLGPLLKYYVYDKD